MRKFIQSSLVLTMFLAFSSSFDEASAQSSTSPYITRALLPFCKSAIDFKQRNTPESAMLEGLCLGLISTSMRLGSVMNEQFKFCAPTDMDPKTFIPILEAFISKTPIALDSDIRDVANYVGRITFPCG